MSPADPSPGSGLGSGAAPGPYEYEFPAHWINAGGRDSPFSSCSSPDGVSSGGGGGGGGGGMPFLHPRSLPQRTRSQEEEYRVATPSSASSTSASKGELRQYSEDEWDAMYPYIKRLYMTERRRLHEVVQLMKQRHGFSATARMYKIRLAKWGLFKNNSKKRTAAATAAAAAASSSSSSRATKAAETGSEADADAEGEDLIVEELVVCGSSSGPLRSHGDHDYANNNRNSYRRRNRECGASGSSSQRRRTRAAGESSSDSDRAAAVRLPRRLSDTPRDLRASSILSRVRAWVPRQYGRRGTGTGAGANGGGGEYETFLRSLRREDLALAAAADGLPSTEMYRSFGLASVLWARGQGRLAGKAVRRAFLLVEEAVTSTDTMLVWNLMDVVCEMAHWGQAPLLRLFLDYVDKIAECRAPDHPVRTIVRNLAESAAESSSSSSSSSCSSSEPSSAAGTWTGTGTNGTNGSGVNDGLRDMAERARRCHLDQVRLFLRAEEAKVRALMDGVSAAEARRGYGDDGRPSPGLIARGIREWMLTAELLRRPARADRSPYAPEPGQERWETRIWYISVAAFVTWAAVNAAGDSGAVDAGDAGDAGEGAREARHRGGSGSGRDTTLRESYGFPSYLKDRTAPFAAATTVAATVGRDGGVYPEIYVQKARLRALVDAGELEEAEELAVAVVRSTDAAGSASASAGSPDGGAGASDGVRSIVARWAFEDLLERAGKADKAQLVREENARRVERFLANIPDQLP